MHLPRRSSASTLLIVAITAHTASSLPTDGLLKAFQDALPAPTPGGNITQLYSDFFSSGSNPDGTTGTPPLAIPGLPNPFQIAFPQGGGFVNGIAQGLSNAFGFTNSRAFQAPSPTDQRGGCPGLNVLANYGYIDRSGITNPAELLTGMFEAYNIAPDLGAILVAVGAVAGMDISTMKVSIGTQDTRTDGPLSNVLGPGPGLFGNGSHNMLENDGSVAFLDEALAHNGDGNVFDPNAWGAAMQAAKEVGGNFDMAWTGRVLQLRQKQCIETNPDCYWGWKKLHSYMANMNAVGLMPGRDLLSPTMLPPTYDRVSKFWGVKRDPTGKYVPAPNEFPLGLDGQWHKPLVPITSPQFLSVGMASYAMHPTMFGGNSGKVNSFITDPTQWNNAMSSNHIMCTLFNAVWEVVPTQLEKPRDAMTKIIDFLLAPARQAYSC